MPDIVLHIPENSRFSSSLNEIDCCMKEILLTEMRIADPRDSTGKVNTTGDILYSYILSLQNPGQDYVLGTKLTVNGLFVEITEINDRGGIVKFKTRYSSMKGDIDKSGIFEAEKKDETKPGSGAIFTIKSEVLNNWLWAPDKVFQVDELTTEDIFDTWLLRNKNKNVDVQYPLLGYVQENIDTVFWGTGNRLHQWYITTPPANSQIEEGDVVIIVEKDIKNKQIFGKHATVTKIINDSYYLTYENSTTKVTDLAGNWIGFNKDALRQTGSKSPITFKAKAITGKYSVGILVDNRDEAQYIRDHFILRCDDANIWFRYKSPILNGVENQIFTVFGIPQIQKHPMHEDKLKGQGYIYTVGFDVNVWATVTDTPLPQEVIEMIRMNLKIKNEPRYQKIVIT